MEADFTEMDTFQIDCCFSRKYANASIASLSDNLSNRQLSGDTLLV